MPLRLPSRPVLYRRTLILLVHVALIPLAYLTAFGLRFDFQIPPQEFAHFQSTVWYLLGIRLIVFWAGGLYRGYWKHVGLRDLVDLGLAVTISSAASAAPHARCARTAWRAPAWTTGGALSSSVPARAASSCCGRCCTTRAPG